MYIGTRDITTDAKRQGKAQTVVKAGDREAIDSKRTSCKSLTLF